jgi:hypothetical protein
MADTPGRRPRFALAVATAIAFLFRHDHGAFVAMAVALLLLLHGGLSWTARLRHCVLYAATTVAVLAPYLVFVQLHVGIGSYVEQTLSWAARERERTPMVWPGLFDGPTAWWYYLELLLPLLALAGAAMSRDGFRPGWSQARLKVAIVALLGILVNVGFLRAPLEARLADPSVPHAIVIAWLAAAVPAMFRAPASWAPTVVRWRLGLATAFAVASACIALVVAATLVHRTYEAADNAGLTEGPRRIVQGAASVARTLRADWQLDTWSARRDRSELVTLAMYLDACTRPGARIFVQPYIPQVLALARRPFAGGHADLRPGFFTTERDQRLTLARLQQQHVPVALLATDDSLQNFRRSFPLITAYLDEHYVIAGAHTFDGRFGITLLVDNRARSDRRFAELDWPCPA